MKLNEDCIGHWNNGTLFRYKPTPSFVRLPTIRRPNLNVLYKSPSVPTASAICGSIPEDGRGGSNGVARKLLIGTSDVTKNSSGYYLQSLKYDQFINDQFNEITFFFKHTLVLFLSVAQHTHTIITFTMFVLKSSLLVITQNFLRPFSDLSVFVMMCRGGGYRLYSFRILFLKFIRSARK